MISLILALSVLLSGCGIMKDTKETKTDGVFYQIFVRSFADSNGDGIGDINGITNQLDKLADMGIKGIWLTPFNPSPSYHKYDVIDYYNVDLEYGTLEDVKTMLKKADELGITVLMDLVINHTSRENRWFREAIKSPDNPYRDYYNWASLKEGKVKEDAYVWGHKVWNKVGDDAYYAIFWEGMPDLNFNNQQVRKEIKDIAKFWLDLGIDGFRCDAAMHIFGAYEEPIGTNLRDKTLGWWKEFKDYIVSVNKNAILLGEVWTSPSQMAPYFESFDMLFDFSIGEESLISMVNTGRDKGGRNNKFVNDFSRNLEIYGKNNQSFIMSPFLTNHDQNRVMSSIQGDVKKAKLLANMYLTLPGTPFIYYGEELGMKGGKPDEQIREPYPWGDKSIETSWEPVLNNKGLATYEEQLSDPESLLNHYRKIIALRNEYKALEKGSFNGLLTTSKETVAYERSYENEKLIILHNLSDEAQNIEFEDGSRLQGDLIMGSSMTTLGPKETCIIKLK